MEYLDWVVWGVGCLVLLIALTLIRDGRVVGRAALFFSVIAAGALALTFFTHVSKLHLLWIFPVTFVLSTVVAVWLGARMMRRGLKHLAANPEFHKFIRETKEKESGNVKRDA